MSKHKGVDWKWLSPTWKVLTTTPLSSTMEQVWLGIVSFNVPKGSPFLSRWKLTAMFTQMKPTTVSVFEAEEARGWLNEYQAPGTWATMPAPTNTGGGGGGGAPPYAA